jgi:hypothetical protein
MGNSPILNLKHGIIGRSSPEAETHSRWRSPSVDSDEVESIFNLRMAVPIGRQVSPEVDEERLCMMAHHSRESLFQGLYFEGRPGSSHQLQTCEQKGEASFYEEVRKTLERIR